MKRTAVLIFAIALGGASLRAQQPQEPTALIKIYSNLGPTAKPYGNDGGAGVSGPLSVKGFSEFVGMPFTPKANYIVRQIRIALLYGGGAN